MRPNVATHARSAPDTVVRPRSQASCSRSCSPCGRRVSLRGASESERRRSVLTSSFQRNAVHTALNLVPFCGVVFLWFMGVIRSQIGDAEDKFFSTIYLGSGLLFVAMLFVVAAIGGGLLSEAGRQHGAIPLDVWNFARPTTYSLVTNFGIRMAGVFIISTSAIGFRVGLIAHRWFARIGFLIGVFLVLVASAVPWIELLFPGVGPHMSVDLLIRTFTPRESATTSKWRLTHGFQTASPHRCLSEPDGVPRTRGGCAGPARRAGPATAR